MLGILFFITRLTRRCLQSLHHHFKNWTKPDTATSLMVGTLTDLARNTFGLMAENALLRQQLLILRRHTKRPVCPKTDRMLLVFLARMVRTWKQAHITRSARDALAVAPSGIQAVLEVQVQSGAFQPEDLPRDRGLNPREWLGTTDYGERNGSGENCSSWAFVSACSTIQKYMRQVRDYQATRTELENLLRYPC